ncbi:hypothetical protein [Natronorubrum sulfidifaciens]|uniref:DUF8119 domain-containing protein n=1 Tax=Natronorubrum sulfidifaciens JCM 14089 TaxID=1230460 RepID=L9W363_9EURY|nr:hypothetical protein [Natronorubrum sulfidifaciens]ELY43880.1 hypothetical protein C495_12485 [Natronorubrum sulfidifaciens JCM 14089]
MASETPDRSSTRSDGTTKAAAITAVRLMIDLVVVTGWVVFLVLFFLQNTWPRWTFYLLLIAGVGLYVTVTAAWRSSDTA